MDWDKVRYINGLLSKKENYIRRNYLEHSEARWKNTSGFRFTGKHTDKKSTYKNPYDVWGLIKILPRFVTCIFTSVCSSVNHSTYTSIKWEGQYCFFPLGMRIHQQNVLDVKTQANLEINSIKGLNIKHYSNNNPLKLVGLLEYYGNKNYLLWLYCC